MKTSRTRGSVLRLLLSTRRQQLGHNLLPQYESLLHEDPAYQFWENLMEWMKKIGFETHQLPADRDWLRLLWRVSQTTKDPNEALHIMQVANWN